MPHWFRVAGETGVPASASPGASQGCEARPYSAQVFTISPQLLPPRPHPSYWSQTEDSSAGDSLSQGSEELLWRSMTFSLVLYLRAENLYRVRGPFLVFLFPKETDEHIETANQYGLGACRRSLLIGRLVALVSR